MTTISRGTIRKRTSQKDVRKVGFEFTLVVDGKRVRRTFPTRAEAVEALEAFKHEVRLGHVSHRILSDL